MKTPLEIAQEAFAGWLGQLDDTLHDAELSFSEAIGAGSRGDAAAMGDALGRAETAVKRARQEIAAGLEQGV